MVVVPASHYSARLLACRLCACAYVYINACIGASDRTRHIELDERLHLRVASITGDPCLRRYVEEIFPRTTRTAVFPEVSNPGQDAEKP